MLSAKGWKSNYTLRGRKKCHSKDVHLELTSISEPLSWAKHSYLDLPEQKLALKYKLPSYR